MWTRGSTFAFISTIVVSMIAILIGFTPLIGAVPAMYFFVMTSREISYKKRQLDGIAIASGHPWHDSDDVGDTTVHVLSETKWIALEPSARLVVTDDPLLNRSLLRDGDVDGEVLVRWQGTADEKIVAIINMAQALANAQDREEGSEDSFEAARERESTGESLLDREWMETEEGAIDYEPGAILRAFKRSRDDDDGPL
jgi:phosphate/sulfate permease